MIALTRWRIACWRGTPSAVAARSWSWRISSGIAAVNSSPQRAHGSGSWSSSRSVRAVLHSRRPVWTWGWRWSTTRFVAEADAEVL